MANNQSSPSNPVLEEAKRRDAIIKKLVENLQYTLGEYVCPHNEDERALYGEAVLVQNICDSYAKLGRKEKWPESDIPLIITAYSKKADTTFFCTPNFLVPLSKVTS